MKAFFFKTMTDRGRSRLRALAGQTMLDGTPVNQTLNVQSDRVIRSQYPLGTVFGSTSLIIKSGFYATSEIYPMGLRDDEYLSPVHRPMVELQKEYEIFIGTTSDGATGDDDKVAFNDVIPKGSMLEKMRSNRELKGPTIKKDGFYVDMNNWYLLLRNVQSQVNTMIVGPTGTGKCLGKDTPVLMYDGTIKMVQDVVVGDKLMGPDSRSRNVLSVTTGREELFRVTPNKGDSWVCNKSHILSLKRNNDGTTKAGTICNVGISEYLTWSKTRKYIYKQWRTAIDFPEKKVFLDPYFLGLWLGDGRTDTPTICTMDEYELFGNKHIPTDFLYNSRKNRLRLFAGLMDTDGSYGAGYFEFVTKLDNLKDEVVYLGRSLGYYAHVVQKEVSGNFYWRITFSGDFSDVPTRTTRKMAVSRKQKKDVLVTGISVESIGEGDYYGFTIDGDHLFCLGDFTVTHNTELVLKACEKLAIDCSVYDMGSMYDPVAGLLGVHRLMEGGISVFDYAKFTQDIQKPGVILLDELSRAPVTTLNILFPCLDSRRMLPVEIAGGKDLRKINVHPDCCFVATANVGAEYTGTISMDRALVNRFFPLELDYMPEAMEIKVLEKRTGIDAMVCKVIVHIANEVRTMYNKQDLSVSLSTREVIMVGELVADGWTPLKAMELVFLPLFEGSKVEGERAIVANVLIAH